METAAAGPLVPEFGTSDAESWRREAEPCPRLIPDASVGDLPWERLPTPRAWGGLLLSTQYASHTQPLPKSTEQTYVTSLKASHVRTATVT